MRNGLIVLLLAVFLAAWRYQTPTPAAVNAPETQFSAARAFTDITALAQKPHPVGSAEHERVRAAIVARMTSLGLSPALQADRATISFRTSVISAPVTNIVGVLKGKNSAAPAVLVMSHYDSVPDSPGAADDTAGVASALEIARALKAAGPPERDVIFLVTDGEELGLTGSSSFFRHHPFAAHVGAVINFEARGDGGLANMFETGPKNGAAVSAFVAKASRVTANSLSRVLYKNMPNGTDLSVAIDKGLPALNFAFIGDEAAYHTPLATPAHLDLGSVQSMGDQGLAATQAFIDAIPAQTSDEVFSDVLGFFVIQYPLWFGWLVLAAAAMLCWIGIHSAQDKVRPSLALGIVAAVCVIAVPAGALYGAGLLFGDLNHFSRLAYVDILMAGAAMLSLGLALTLSLLFTRRKIRPAALWQVLLVLLLVLGVAAQIFVPEAAYVVVWPVLVGGLIATVRYAMFRSWDGIVPLLIADVLALIYLAMTLVAGVAIFTAVGVDMPVVLMLPLLTGLPVLLLLPAGRKIGIVAPLVLIGVGVLVFAGGRYIGPSADRPAPATVRYVKDLDSGKAYRVSYLGADDPWTEKALGKPQYAELPWSDGRKLWWGEAVPVNLPDSDVVMMREGGKLYIAVQPRAGAWVATISVRSETGLAPSSFQGLDIPAIPAGAWHDFRYYLPDREGFSWVVEAPRDGKVEVKVVTLYPYWPNGAAPLPALPAERMAFGNFATSETVKRRVWTP